MLLELAEILACPACGPPQVMVAVVHESAGHRVTHGFLGCPACDARFPIEEGTVHLVPQGVAELPSTRRAAYGSTSAEVAVLVGAVLELARGPGHVLLGPELAVTADAVAALAEGWEVVSLLNRRPKEAPESVNVSQLVVGEVGVLPGLHGRFRAAALGGDPEADRIRAVAAVLAPLGRLAIVAPGTGAVAAMRDAGFEMIAADDRVAVASRRP